MTTAQKIVAAARRRIGDAYVVGYVPLRYPGGDVPRGGGVCTNVVVRALRAAGYDLQRLIHEDMRTNFSAYPRKWGLRRPDPSIDHRRVPNQQRFFERRGVEAHEATARAIAFEGMSVPDDQLVLEVRLALRHLPGEQAAAMTMYYLDGADIAAVAASLGRPTGTVKWMLSRGRANLSLSLEGYKTVNNDQQSGPHSWRVALVAPALSLDYREELAKALAASGWDEVRSVAETTELLRFSRSHDDGFALPAVLDGCRLVVIDERIGGISSAFELLPLFAAARRRGDDFALLLLLDAGRNQEETDAAVLSAYVSGVDMLLVKPFATEEFAIFAGRIRQGSPVTA